MAEFVDFSPQLWQSNGKSIRTMDELFYDGCVDRLKEQNLRISRG